MASVSSIKNEMHVATSGQLTTLKEEADAMVLANPSLANWFRYHVYREYNRRRFNKFGGVEMITPYDGGFTPYQYVPTESGVEESFLLESGDNLLLENGDNLLLE